MLREKLLSVPMSLTVPVVPHASTLFAPLTSVSQKRLIWSVLKRLVDLDIVQNVLGERPTNSPEPTSIREAVSEAVGNGCTQRQDEKGWEEFKFPRLQHELRAFGNAPASREPRARAREAEARRKARHARAEGPAFERDALPRSHPLCFFATPVPCIHDFSGL